MIPVEQRYRLVSSRDVAEPARKDFDLGPAQTLTLCRIEGAGRVVRFWFTLPLFRQRHALKDLVLSVYWDGEDTPSIEVPVGDFFGASFGRPLRLTYGSFLVVGGAYTCLLPMPFNERAVFQLRNDSTRTLRTIFFRLPTMRNRAGAIAKRRCTPNFVETRVPYPVPHSKPWLPLAAAASQGCALTCKPAHGG